MDIWTPKIGGENFCLKSENEHHSNCTIGCKVTGKCVNRGTGYGLEIPVQYRFIGAENAVEWAEKNIKKVFENMSKKVLKCVN